MPAALAEALIVPYRTIRRIDAGTDAPLPATLCRLESGATALLVDVDDLPARWPGWSAQSGGHILHPLDVVRRPDGHDVLLPVLAVRLTDLLQRRRGEARGLTDGEAVTLAVSLLRGLMELRSEWPADRGEWWLTDAGFPTMVAGCGQGDAAEATIALLDEIADGRPATPWRDVVAAAGHPHLPAAEAARLEDELFAFARASAVDLAAARGPAPGAAAGARWTGDELEAHAPRTLWEQLARHVDSDLADVFSRATTGVWRRVRSRPARTSRTRAVALAIGAAALVLCVGLLWPHEASSEASDALAGLEPTPTSSPTTSSGAAQPTPLDAGSGGGATVDTGGSPPGDPSDLAMITAALLTARSGCLDSACAAEVVVDPASDFAHGVIDLPDADRVVTLIDEFGGVAVLRVDAVDGAIGSQLVVIELAGDRWLLRDVHVAQQP